jgi:ribonuclease BN (tRNA processing enzyme)
LGGSGLWPRAGQACSGYLLSHDDVRLLIDPGYGVLAELLRHCAASEVDAVLISHGHLDHCADLVPLLRARAFELADGQPALPVVAPDGALTALFELGEASGAVDGWGASVPVELIPPSAAKIGFGPLTVSSAELRHHQTTYGFRITDPSGAVFVYTADSGPSPDRVDLARDAGVLLAETTYPDGVPDADARYLSDARQVASLALDADVDHCVITHLHPSADPIQALTIIRRSGLDSVEYARPGLTREVILRPAATGLPRRAAPKVITMTSSLPRRAAQ